MTELYDNEREIIQEKLNYFKNIHDTRKKLLFEHTELINKLSNGLILEEKLKIKNRITEIVDKLKDITKEVEKRYRNR